MCYKPEKIYVEKNVLDNVYTEKVLRKLPDIPVEVVDDYKTINLDKPFPDRALIDKNSLGLAEKKGELIKNIGRMGSNQYYLFHEIDCRYDCEYCYLQYYFQTKVPIIFVNRDIVLDKIEQILTKVENSYFNVGEVCDALAFDHLTEFSNDITELFLKYPEAKVEFRTKSTNIENLIHIEKRCENLIPSWTMNPKFINYTIEHKTPDFEERLQAAKECQDHGYTVGIRLDPVFKYEGWETDYEQMISRLLSVLHTDQIDYISLGTIKMHKLLVDAIRTRYPKSLSVTGEILPSEDGKFRYIKFDRVEIYKQFIDWIRSHSSNIKIELSLETQEVKDLVFSDC